MPLNLASPGVIVREVDVTVGRVDPTSNSVAAIVAPFEKGPVESAVLIQNEQELLANFGQPRDVASHYETWFTASSFLAYGGNLLVLRSDGTSLYNANQSVTGVATSIKIKSYDDYVNKGYNETAISNVVVAARNPGSWGNGLQVAIIDARADQILSGITTTSVVNFNPTVNDRSGIIVGSASTIGISTASVVLGQVVRCEVNGVISSGTTVTSIANGVIGISTSSLQTTTLTALFDFGTETSVGLGLTVGYGVTQSISGVVSAGIGSTTSLDGFIKGIITGVGASTLEVKVSSYVSAAGVETQVDYEPQGVYRFKDNGSVTVHSPGSATGSGTTAFSSSSDWYDAQTITLNNGTIAWNTIAPRPGTSRFAASRGSRFDELHVAVIDGTGNITGNAGTVLEKHVSLSKAKNAIYSAGSSSYWSKYIAEGSSLIFGGSQPTGVVTCGFTTSSTFGLGATKDWNTNTENNTTFKCVGSVTYTLSGGKNYDATTNLDSDASLQASLSDLSSGYDLLTNTEQYDIDFILMGSAAYDKERCQALASKIISVAEQRQDAIAFVSPYRNSMLNLSGTSSFVPVNSASITTNVISYYASIPSSSYAIFDSGYKYMYDKFSQTFRYIPLNGDIAGICARNDTTNAPWVSPAGTSRGAVLNAVKLAYNPSKIERDKLYSNRVNPVIFSPGSGIILFGDKTGLAKASAFDRINVRRLFIYIETAIKAAADDQLFEFNDETTRTNFVNIVDPFLRDILAKRGIIDYRVICDESNNTASIIDNNEFVGDIYVKPSRSINFVGLTFVATRSGVSFEEIVGNV